MTPAKAPAKPPEGANAPRKPTKPEKPAKRPKGAEGVDLGDSVYVRHPKRGAIAVSVTGLGKDGFTGRCDQGEKHRVPWDGYLGHKARLLHRYELLEQGSDGALVKDGTGRQRFIAGMEMPEPEEKAAREAAAIAQDDPIVGGLDELEKPLKKALTEARPMLPMFPPNARVLLLKAEGDIKGRPGLALKDVTDKGGHQTKRWEKSGMEQKPADKGPAPIQHGDTVGFRHGDVGGEGKVVASGQDGVTVHDANGIAHQVRHEHLTGRVPARPQYPDRTEGEEDKPYLKRIKDSLPDPDHLPEEHDRYFNQGPKTKTVPMDQLVSSKSAAENEKGGNNAPKFMAAAYHGVVGKRDPINAKKRPDGKYEVTDGNGTLTGVQKHGWKALPVNVEGEDGGQGDAGQGGKDAGANPAPLFDNADLSLDEDGPPQPVNDEDGLYEMAAPALDALKEWLNKGKGICSQLGYDTMGKAPENVAPDEWDKSSGMLFIAPLKGRDRAKEKVDDAYNGDWNRLLDVVRCTIAVDKHEDLTNVLAKLKQSGLKLSRKPKDRFNKPTKCGYRDVLMNVVMPNGCIGEVQLNIKSMLKAKNDGHAFYETERSILPKIEKGTASDEDRAKVQEAQKSMSDLYNSAWQSATNGAQSQPMAKALKGAKPMAGKQAAGNQASGADTFFDYDNAKFRRRAGADPLFRGVHDVLAGDQWKPYAGDKLAPGLYGDEIPDPSGGGDGGERAPGGDQGGAPPAPAGKPMTKALLMPMVFLRPR